MGTIYIIPKMLRLLKNEMFALFFTNQQALNELFKNNV